MELKSYLSAERGRASKMAQRLGISRSHLSDVANGNRTPSLDLAVRIWNETGGLVTPSDVLSAKKEVAA
jgi:DNA-binding transcriptional regulator YdaS (Cro superfamily)